MNISYYFEDGKTEHSLECDVAYVPACSGSYRLGQQQEPDSPAIMEVCGALLNGIDVLMLLSQDVINSIKRNAWDRVADEQQEYDA